MKNPKVAFFDFACCEGCQLQVANMGEAALDVLGVIDVVEWREVMSEKWNKKFDIAIVEGSIRILMRSRGSGRSAAVQRLL